MKSPIDRLKRNARQLLIKGAIACTITALFLNLLVQPLTAASLTDNLSRATARAEQAKQAEREQAYEAAVEVAEDPQGPEEEYEKNLEAYYDSHPEESPNLLQEAEELIETVVDETSQPNKPQ